MSQCLGYIQYKLYLQGNLRKIENHSKILIDSLIVEASGM